MTRDPPSGPRWPVRLLVLLALAAVIVVGRLRLSSAPLHGDTCAYALIGHEMTVVGRPLYADLWERKPPLLYLTFAAAERLVGYGPGEVTLVNVAFAVAGLFAVYAAAGGWTAGLFAAGLWALLCADLDLVANQPEPELFINVMLAGAFAVLLRWPERRRAWAPLLVGALMAAATMYKHNVALACAALLAGHVVGSPRRWRAVAEATVAGGVIVAAWAALFIHACAVGRLAATVDVLFRQNVAYAGGGFGRNLLVGLLPARLFPPFALALAAPAAMVVAYAVAARAGRRRARTPARPGRAWGLLIAWALGSWATVSLTGLLYPHYYQLWLPVACVAGGWAAVGLWRSASVPARSVVVIALLVVLARQGGQFLLPPDQWPRRQYDYSVANQNEMAARLDRVLRPDETFWELGEDNALYFLTRRDPPSGYLFLDPLLYGGGQTQAWQRLRADLQRRPPRYVIVSSDWQMFIDPARTPIWPWVTAHYRPWQTWVGSSRAPKPTTYWIYIRR